MPRLCTAVMCFMMGLFLASCARDRITFEMSADFCKSGKCSKTPVLVLVAGVEPENSRLKISHQIAGYQEPDGFITVGYTEYDGRINVLGPKLLTYRDRKNRRLCEGFYDWNGFSSYSPVELTCFDDGVTVTGEIRTNGRQKKGIYRGKGTGTGIMKFDGGFMLVIYGIDPPELQKYSFKELWDFFGGDVKELPKRNYPAPNDKNLPASDIKA